MSAAKGGKGYQMLSAFDRGREASGCPDVSICDYNQENIVQKY